MKRFYINSLPKSRSNHPQHRLFQLTSGQVAGKSGNGLSPTPLLIGDGIARNATGRCSDAAHVFRLLTKAGGWGGVDADRSDIVLGAAREINCALLRPPDWSGILFGGIGLGLIHTGIDQGTKIGLQA